jgi:epoxyqueuosine reductase
LSLTTELQDAARKLGLDFFGVVAAAAVEAYAGIDVAYWELRRRTARPCDILPDAKAVVVVGLGLWDRALDTATYEAKLGRWVYPAYAVLEQRCDRLALWLERRGARVAVTGRLSLKNLAALAGFGVFGKNSLLLSHDFGPDFRLACFVTDADLEPEHPAAKPAGPGGPGDRLSPPAGDLCGDCVLCLDACPMGALTPYVVDPESCLVSLSLRAKGGNLAEVDLAVRERCASLDIPAYEPRFGGNLHLMCRACQDVCPQPSKALRFPGNSVQRLTSD